METMQLEKVEVKEKKKERSDKGQVRLQERDTVLLRWIAEQYAIRLDQLQVLIAMNSENPNRVNPQKVTERAAIKTVNRWKLMGWVEYRKVLHGVNNPGWVWLTLKGLREFGYQYAYREPTISQFSHYFWVNHVRLSLESRHGNRLKWISERYNRFSTENKLEHYADGEIVSKSGLIAVEVELTQKATVRQKKIIDSLDLKTNAEGRNYYYKVWYYVNDVTQKQVENSIAQKPKDRFECFNLKEVSLYG